MTGPSHFCTTRWTVVLQAGDRDSAQRDAALAELLEAYWYPLYGFIRRQGYSDHEAEDLLQGFIARLLEKDSLSHVRKAGVDFETSSWSACEIILAERSGTGQLAKAWRRPARDCRSIIRRPTRGSRTSRPTS